MTYQQLQSGEKLSRQIAEYERVLEYLQECYNGKTFDVEKFLKLFSDCRNVGTTEIKTHLVEACILHSKQVTENILATLQSEFELL